MTIKGYHGAHACVLLSAFIWVACGHAGSNFQKDDKQRMTEGKQAPPIVYVALGDSTGVGVGAHRGGGYVARLFERIERVRPGSRLINLCVSGATTSDVLRGQVARVEGQNPTLLTLGIGVNDVGQNVTVEQFARNYEEIVSRLKEKTSAPMVITNIPDVSFSTRVPAFMQNDVRRRILLFNQRIQEIAERYQVLVADAYTMSHDSIPSHPEFFSADGFHPSDAGYEFWAKTMWPTVKAAIGEG